MDGLVLIINTVSLSLACMALALSIASYNFHKQSWLVWYIVFQSCLIFTILLFHVNTISVTFFSKELRLVFWYIFRIMTHATIGFVTVVLPYFLKWILNKSWGAKQRCVFYPVGIVYFASGLIAVLNRNETMLPMIQTPIFVSLYVYCLIILRINQNLVEDKRSRGICNVVIIVSLSLIPVAILAVIIPGVELFSYPAYVIAFSIIMIVFFYERFRVDASRMHKKEPVNRNALDSFKITGRESTVIELICSGLTNKEIAGKLNISVNTVNNHVANIFEKMGARSRVDLIRMMRVGPWD